MDVLFAYDRSRHCEFALSSLRSLPCVNEIDLSLVTVIPSPPVTNWTSSAFTNDPSEILQNERKACEQVLQEVATMLQGEFRSVRTQTLTGSAGFELVKYVANENTDLIVTGAIGASAISRVLLGSVSDYVTMLADCSALVIRPTQNQPTPNPSEGSPASEFPEALQPRRVLVAVGNAKSDRQLTDWITRLGLPPQTDVDLVYVMEDRPEYKIGIVRKASLYLKEIRSAAAEHIDAMSSQLGESGHRVNTSLVDAAHIGKAIVDHAIKHDCDLIITGDQRGTYSERVLLGSTARHVLRQSPCSVLVARTKT